MATPIVVVAAGGWPVVEATNGFGLPVTLATNGYGTPVTLATNGYGMPVVFDPPLGPATPPVDLFAPIVSVIGGGAPVVDEILVCTQGSWTGSNPKTYDYQWYRTPAADTTAPTITSASSASNPENTVLAHALTANETVTWSIVGGADAARFELSGSTLRWASNGVKDYEAPNDANTDNAYVVTVRATDTASNTTDQTVTVTVTNVAEIVNRSAMVWDVFVNPSLVRQAQAGGVMINVR